MSNRGLLIAGAIIVVIAAGVAILFTVGEGSSGDGVNYSAIPTPQITGNVLFPHDAAASADPSIGAAAPEVVGASFDLSDVAIVDDGRAKVLVFLAHWCPHCQAEVPSVQEWIEAGGKPDNVDLYSVATSIDELRPNYPPDAWLTREGWTAPVLVDPDNTVSFAYGLTSFPFWVFVNSDGTVAGRISGEIPQDQLTPIFEVLR